MLTEQYALYGLATAAGAVPAAKVAGSLSAAAVVLTIFLLFVLVLLFPDGRLPSPRWRPVLWALALPGPAQGGPPVQPRRYSAERMLAAFAARLTEELDADAVAEDLARSVHAALEPAHISVWLSERPG